MKPITITANTRFVLSLGTAITICMAIVTGSVKVVSILSKIDARLAALEKDQFSMARASEVALRTKIANPSQRVIDPREPTRLLEVGLPPPLP